MKGKREENPNPNPEREKEGGGRKWEKATQENTGSMSGPA